MKIGRTLAILLALTIISPLFIFGGQSTTPAALASPVPGRSFFGMNLYVTGLERPKDERIAMISHAQDLGVRWSREEMSWANLEPYQKGNYNWGAYDPWINELLAAGIGVVGSIQTTPAWASGANRAEADWYWRVPNNPQDFGDFVYAAAMHYKGKIHYWEMWNEPDVPITFKCNNCDPAKVYAQMLSAGYQAVKRADPTAQVLIGGLSVHDYNNQGMLFLDQVVAASGGKINFDILSIHPYMPDRIPESTDPNTVVQNFPYRLDNAYKWLVAHGAGNKEIWVTEDGYSTCTGCGNLGVSEDEQALLLVRLNVIAMASPNVTQFDYFQLKDKFNAGASDLFGNMSIMRNDMSFKPAYKAYKIMTQQLEGATFVGPGPLMHQVSNRWQVQYDTYHYIFAKGGTRVHVIWKIGVPARATLKVTQPGVAVFNTGGQRINASPVNGSLSLQISETPLYVVESPDTDTTLDTAQDTSSPTGYRPSDRFASYWQANGGLPMFGYAITPERVEKSATDGKNYIVQWFERARFEYHPEYAGTKNEVLLGLLGVQLTNGRQFATTPPPANVESVCAKETGHCVWGRFLDRWRELGVPIVGLPISDQQQERSTDGRVYWVQYFERARFEYHPENKPPFDVLLGLLGTQLYRP